MWVLLYWSHCINKCSNDWNTKDKIETNIYFLKNILKIQKIYIIVIHNDLMI